MLAQAALHPFTFRYQQRRSGCDWLPDAVTDTTGKRKRGARRLFGDGAGILCRLLTRPRRHLYHLVIHLPREIDFYIDAPLLARKVLGALLGDTPLYAKLALSRGGAPHIHVLAMLEHAPPQSCLYGRVYCAPVTGDEHLQALAEYVSRPSDERACRPRPKDLTRYATDELETQALAASELYLHARARMGGCPLPRRSWTANLPFLRVSPDLAETGGIDNGCARHLLNTAGLFAICLVPLAWVSSVNRARAVVRFSEPCTTASPSPCGLYRCRGSWARAPPAQRGMSSSTAPSAPLHHVCPLPTTTTPTRSL